ncbi:MAG: magnesium/cobalt transporter CorA [Synergistaceae bacterium]|nr:magnesium/cobalt transporter CorA [Synergistaceae bacterium]
MRRKERKEGKGRRESLGSPPGSLIHVGERKTEEVVLSYFRYGPDHFEEGQVTSPAELPEGTIGDGVLWINVDGLHDPSVMDFLGERFGIHSLTLEDILNTTQRPKMEDQGEHLFLVLKMVDIDASSGALMTEQVSLVIGRGFLLSFQERPGDVFSSLRERLRGGAGRLRKTGPDYLAYGLVDLVVDRYFAILEHLDFRIEGLEEELILVPGRETLQSIHGLKRLLSTLRLNLWPLREALAALRREEGGLIAEGTRPYLADLYDHAVQVLETIESLREIVAGMIDLYLSSLSNRMNEVMKVLTVIATLFIPLTFLTGVYGMNFDYMPELHWPWAYPVLWGVMAVLLGSMLAWFRKKGWLGRPS